MAASESNISQSVLILAENSHEVFLDASELLLKLGGNLLNKPDNPIYRRIRVGNPIVQKRLLPVTGALECLFEMGFEEDDEFLSFPVDGSLHSVKLVLESLNETKTKISAANAVENNEDKTSSIKSHNMPSSSQQAQSTSASMNQSNTATLKSEVAFFGRVKSDFDHVLVYEDPMLQQEALQCIPVDRLRAAARAKAESDPGGVDVRDFLLLELLAWFKLEFFRWVDAPRCRACGGKTTQAGNATPTPEELRWGAGRVEDYTCTSCATRTRFPRYNHPGKLLQTREGRCGEWANCFTLCCRAVGFEARHVLDWTDHVWTEVYSQHQGRWLHCDSCENACDKPLVYEAGWGKKLTYVLAFSRDDVQDVTWRYSANHEKVRQRRHQCRESWLLGVLSKLRKQRQDNLSESRKKELKDRLLTELVEFLSTKSAADGEKVGRQTGSLAWRSTRGELGTGTVEPAKQVQIKPTAAEKAARLIHVKYSCVKDEYLRVSDNDSLVAGWRDLVFQASNASRKVELDWNMVYIARTEGSSEARVSWQVDLSDTELAVDVVQVKAEDKCYEDGQIQWILSSDETSTKLTSDGTLVVVKELRGARSMTLTAILSGGRGDVAWQHTQLFRQKRDDVDDWPLEIIISLNKI